MPFGAITRTQRDKRAKKAAETLRQLANAPERNDLIKKVYLGSSEKSDLTLYLTTRGLEIFKVSFWTGARRPLKKGPVQPSWELAREFRLSNHQLQHVLRRLRQD